MYYFITILSIHLNIFIFKDNLGITTLQPSSKWSFANSGSSKSSTFTSNNTYAALNDDKKSSNSQIM